MKEQDDKSVSQASESLERAPSTRRSGTLSKLGQEDVNVFKWLAHTLLPTGMIPRHIDTPGKMIAVILMGDELGIARMTALRGMYVGKDGKPTMTTQLALSKMRQCPQWEDMKIEETDDGSIKCTMKRKGQTPHTEVFGDAEAKALGLLGKQNYQQQKTNMFKWRAIMACGRVVYPDYLEGVYSMEEMGVPTRMTDEGHFVLDEDAVVESSKVERRSQAQVERDQVEEAPKEKPKPKNGRKKTGKKPGRKKATEKPKPVEAEEADFEDTPEEKAEESVPTEGQVQMFTQEQSAKVIDLFNKSYDDGKTLIIQDDEAERIRKALGKNPSFEYWRDVILKMEQTIVRRYEEAQQAAKMDAEEPETEEEEEFPDPFAD